MILYVYDMQKVKYIYKMQKDAFKIESVFTYFCVIWFWLNCVLPILQCKGDNVMCLYNACIKVILPT